MLAPSEITVELVKQRVSDTLSNLRAQAPNYKRWRGEVAAALNVDPRTVDNWLAGDTAPDLHHWLALVAHLGDELRFGLFDLIDLPLGEPSDTVELVAEVRAVLDRHMAPKPLKEVG